MKENANFIIIVVEKCVDDTDFLRIKKKPKILYRDIRNLKMLLEWSRKMHIQ